MDIGKLSSHVHALDMEFCKKILEMDLSQGQTIFLFFRSHLMALTYLHTA